jgi:hypothetical protein
MKMISAVHFSLDGDIKMSFLETGGHTNKTDKLFVTIEDATGYPGIVLSIPQIDFERYARAMAAFNRVMEATDGINA